MELLRRFRVEYGCVTPPDPDPSHPIYFHVVFATDELDAWKKHAEAFPDEEVTNVVEVLGVRKPSRDWVRK